jgi:hypothetical protein
MGRLQTERVVSVLHTVCYELSFVCRILEVSGKKGNHEALVCILTVYCDGMRCHFSLYIAALNSVRLLDVELWKASIKSVGILCIVVSVSIVFREWEIVQFFSKLFCICISVDLLWVPV